jgi:hypothetical protein
MARSRRSHNAAPDSRGNVRGKYRTRVIHWRFRAFNSPLNRPLLIALGPLASIQEGDPSEYGHESWSANRGFMDRFLLVLV